MKIFIKKYHGKKKAINLKYEKENNRMKCVNLYYASKGNWENLSGQLRDIMELLYSSCLGIMSTDNYYV